tara:strand:+ start:2714 stop:2839 length:126 start_codon:yes stop_codon:yes gene_type:complete
MIDLKKTTFYPILTKSRCGIGAFFQTLIFINNQGEANVKKN